MGFLTKQKKALRVLSLVILTFTIMLLSTSCNKDKIEPLPEMITQSFTLQPIVEQVSDLKSFDPDAWVYNYSTVKYDLIIDNGENTYTISCSADELINTGVSIKMVTGTYDVTYTPTHGRFDNNVDISIDNPSIDITGDPIALTGELDDALIIVDLQGVTDVDDFIDAGIFETLYQHANGFFYGYTAMSAINLRILYNGNVFDPYYLVRNNIQKGKVYWYVDEFGAGVTLDIPTFEVQKEGVEKSDGSNQL